MNTQNYLILSMIVFFIGLFGVMVRRNIIVIMMSIELMLNAANLAFITYSKELQHMGGQMSVFFIITVAAAESAVGLGLVIALFRNTKSVSTEEITLMKF